MTGAATSALLLAFLAAADPDVAAIERDFQYGQFGDVYERAVAKINGGGLSEDELLVLQKVAGLSAFYLQQQEDAERHLKAVIRLSPDFSLDPFVVPPPAIAFFEQLKKDLEHERFVIRQERRAREESIRREKEIQERIQRENEEQRRRIEALSRRITVREVQRPSWLVNLVPFGAGQFQQGRNGRAVALAATEGVLAATSIIAFVAYGSLIETRTDEVLDRQATNGTFTVTRVGIPASRRREAETWKLLKYASAAGFYAVYGYGVADSLYHHQDEIVVERVIEAPVQPPPPRRAPPPKRTPDPIPQPEPEPEPAPDPPADVQPEPPRSVPVTPAGSSSTPLPFLFPTEGGVGAGFSMTF